MTPEAHRTAEERLQQLLAVQAELTRVHRELGPNAELEPVLATVLEAVGAVVRHQEQTRELERLKADFMARVSHELRTPLTIISGFTTTLIAHDKRLDADQRLEMLGRIDTASDRLLMLIDELLTVTAFEAGVVTPNLEAVAVTAVLEGVVADLVSGLGRTTPDPSLLAVDCPPDLTLVTDQRLVRHAVRLLVDNALKYGSAVVLRGATSAEGHAVIEVVDDGPGVPPDMRERIFERFTRGDDDTKPGMGLGLPLVKLLAGGLDAGVAVDDGPDGRGAVFRLVFAPLPAPAPAANRDAR